MNPPHIGYLLCDDLFFASRIEGTARALSLELTTCRKPADLIKRAAERPPACVIVDVNQEGLAIEELIGAPVALLSTSPDRDDTILVRDPFAD